MKDRKVKAITLGIDIGLSSIGWALVENQKQFIDGGVHIFTNGGDDKANATRREKRLERRQTRRRSMRIRRLIHNLADTPMLPINTIVNLRKQLDKAARLASKERHAPTTSSDTKALKDFFDLSPWVLRKKAIQGEKLTAQELGRVFYHFAHQRGFPKRSLRTLEGDKKADEEAKTLKEGSPKDDKIGADATQEKVEKQEKEHRYLGYYLANLLPSKGIPPYKMGERIRSRYTYREMYEAEFDHIWKMQRHHHPALLTQQRKAAIKHILFSQLPLQTPPRGQCTFEPNKKRAYLASLRFEEFRAYQYVNNFLAQYGLTTPAARMPFLEKAIAEFLGRKSGVAPSQLAKKLQLSNANKATSNRDTQDKEPKRAEFQFTTQLRNLFGSAAWDAYTPAEKNDRWHIIFRKINQLKDIDNLEKYAKKHWHFKDKQIADLRKIIIPKGVGNISEKAIRYILPYLKRGYRYDQAVLLGSICKAFGHNFDQETLATNHWATLSEAEKEAIDKQAHAYLAEKAQKARDHIIHYLKAHYPKKALYTTRIYHHSNFALPKQHEKKLPLPDPTRNPIVDKALIQLRRVVNAMMKKHHLTEIPCIRIEMARELKNSPKARKKTEDNIKKHTRERADAYQHLYKNNLPTTPYNIQKYRLWKEVNYTCPFSGKKISIGELYGKLNDGDNAVEIEHIRPVTPKDNRWINLTIALRNINQDKDKGTPYELFGADSAKWEAIKRNVKACFSPKKYDHFISEEPLDKQLLTQREIGLTGYIARETKNYLQHISPDVENTQGGIISTLRREWKLNELLSPSFICKQADSTLDFKGKTIKEGATCYVAYREAEAGEVHTSEGWQYLSKKTVLPQCVLVDIAPFEPAFKGRDTEEIHKDIKKCLSEFKKLTTITDKAVKTAQEKALKNRLKGYHDENRDQERHNNSVKKALIANLKKRAKATLGHPIFHIIEARLQKKNNDQSKKDMINTFYLKPNEPKNRSDHRHHLIDACVIATTAIKHTQRINTAAGEGKHNKERQYNISAPWRSFWEDMKELLSRTLISIDQPLKICAKAKKRVKIPRYDQATQGKRYRYITAQGLTARGQLCKETFYGQYLDKDGKKKYHVRKPITAIQTLKQADKIVDEHIRMLVKAHISQHEENKVPFFIEHKEGNKIVGRAPLLFLHKKGDKTAIASPIKSVRIAENSECMKPAKSNGSNNSWVNPRNNKIAGFYYNKGHAKNPWTVQIVTFWDAVQLSSQKKKLLSASNEARGALCFTLKINDFLLFPPKAWQGNSLEDLQLLPIAQLTPYLYRVQKIDQNGNFAFRKHIAATLGNPLEQLLLVCSSLLKRHPIKVTINKLGEIIKWQVLNTISS
ncbi:MAG: type II CRISPR RNA-guided endonuclease Cas9 [Bacteroidota bacterium]